MYSYCRVKNIDTVTATYVGQELTAGQEYQIQDNERIRWATDDPVIAAITDDKLQVDDSSTWIVSYNDQLSYLRMQIAILLYLL